MSDTVTVLHLVAGTVVEDTWTAERITFQHWPDGGAQVNLWHDGRRTTQVSYRAAERIHRTLSREDASRAEVDCEACGGPCRDESDMEDTP